LLRLRTALATVAVIALAGLARLHVAGGLDIAATERALGTQLAQLGLPAVGSRLLNRASTIYAERVRSGKAAAARARLVECEFALAQLFRERGKAAQAKQHYARVKSVSPERTIEAKAWSAYVDAQAGQTGSRKALLGLMVDAPDDPVPPHLVGRLFLEAGQLAEAERFLKKSLALPNGKTHAATLALAQATQSAGGDAALQGAQEALALAVTPGEKRRAAQLLKELGAEGPDPTVAWLQAFGRQHHWGLIAAAATLVLLFSPTWIGLLARLAPTLVAPLYLLSRSSAPSAIRTYEAALQRRPNSAALLRALATAYRRTGMGARRASDLWERLYALDPDDEEARDQTVRLALETGSESDASLRACQDWFEANPQHLDAGAVAAHLARGYRARSTMPPPGALPAVEMAAAAAPGDRDLRLFLATLQCHHGRHREAAGLLETMLAEKPFDEATRLQYAHALIGAGEPYAAFRHLRLLPPTAETTTDLYLAGVAAQNAGRQRESLRILQEVVRRDPSLFDVDERIADASARAVRGRTGPCDLSETVAICEAHVLHRAVHPHYGDVLLLVFRRDFSDALEFPSVFAEQFGPEHAALPGCARVLEAGSDEEEYFVVYQTPTGASLAQVLELRGPMAPSEAASAMSRVLAALAELHDASRLHGDLRLASVWLDDDVGATLVGAGASMVAEAAPNAPPPGARSPFNVAPEVVQQRHLSAASDIYAAGCMLYELLVGSPPLQGPTHLAAMMAHVTIEPEPPSMRAPGIPPELDELVLFALAKAPAQRPATARLFADALAALCEAREEPASAQERLAVAELDLPPAADVIQADRPDAPIDPTRWWTAYHQLTPIATGRFTRVYRGAHRQSGEWHAIKQLQLPHSGGGAEGLATARASQALLRLFANEMHVLQALSEADPPAEGLTVMLQAYRSDERAPAYAMPLMHETLAEHIEREGPMPEGEAVRAFIPLALTVGRLHERAIVHRGISPRSVMFDRRMLLLLGGFDGACRLAEREALLAVEHEVQQACRSPLQALGDVRYLSPERCRGEDFDARTDVYSLGALLFFMLVGAAPFERPDEMQIMLDHVSSFPPRIEEWQVHAGQRTQEVIDRALAKAPSARYPHAAAMVEALTGETFGGDRSA